jgi:hypothetical protein
MISERLEDLKLMPSEKLVLGNIDLSVIIVNKFAIVEGHCLFDRWMYSIFYDEELTPHCFWDKSNPDFKYSSLYPCSHILMQAL